MTARKIFSGKFLLRFKKACFFVFILFLTTAWTYGAIPVVQDFSPPVNRALAANAWSMRQEINIIDGYLGAATGVYATSSAIINLDKTKYSGTATFYFEVVASTSASIASNVYLKTTEGATLATVSIPTGTTNPTLIRSSPFVPNGASDLVAVIGNESGATKSIKAARIIVLQSFAGDANSAATSTQTQIEIGNKETGKSNTSSSALSNPKYWTYTSDKWDGNLTFYAEATYQNTQTSSSTVFTTATTSDRTISVPTTAGISYITVEAWGAGGGGSIGNAGGGGGGGGAYARSIFATTTGSTNTLFIPRGGITDTAASAGDATFNYFSGCTAATCVIADGGTGTNGNTAGTGGTTGNSIGNVTESAGGGGGLGHTTSDVGGGGGGAGGPNGAGITASGATANTPTAGGAGNSGSGGAGGAAGTGDGASCPTSAGKAGVNNVLGGGGGGGADGNGTNTCTGGAGGYPGGGGGSSELAGATQDGGAGQIKLTEIHGAVGIAIEEDDGNFGNWQFKAQIVANGVSTSTASRARSASFTPTNGRHYRLVASTTNSAATYDIYNAKIVIDQTDTENTYYFNASDAAVSDPNAAWASDANAFDGSTTNSALTTIAGSDSSNYLMAEGTNAPTSGNAIASVMARVYASNTNGPTTNAKIYTDGLAEVLGIATNDSVSAAWGSYVTLSTPSGGWTWQKVNDLEVKLYMTGGTGGPSVTVAKVEVKVVESSEFTKLETQYLLANTRLASGTTRQNFDSWWKPSEWSGVSNTYLHAVDSADGSTAVVVAVATSTGSTITNSSITLSGSYDQHATSTSALTMPASNEGLDAKYTTENNGNVYGTRILVQVSVTQSITVSGTVYASEGGSNIGSGKTINIYKNGSTLLASPTTNGSGVYSGSVSGVSSGDILTAYIDGDTTDGVTVFVSDGTSKTDVHIYGGALAIRYDTGTSITNANLHTGAVYGEADMIYSTSTGNAITLNSGAELHVWSEKTYVPGASVTTQGTGDFHIDDNAVATLGSGTITIGDDFVVDTGATLNINTTANVGGDIATAGTASVTTTAGTPTVTMTGTGVLGGGSNALTFYNLSLGSSASITANSAVVTNSDLTLGSGSTLSGTSNVTVVGGDVNGTGGSGGINMTGGTFEIRGTGNLGLNAGALTFYSLAIGNGAAASTTLADTNNITVSNNFTIGSGSKFQGTSTASFSVGGSWTNSGTYYPYNGTVTFTSSASGKTITSGTGGFYNISFTGAGDWTPQDTLAVANDLSISSGSLLGSQNINVNGGDATGSGTINLSGGIFTLDGAGLFGGSGSWTFNRLTFGDGSGVSTTTSTGSGSITAATTTVANNQILDAGVGKTWNLTSSHEPFQLLGTFLASSSSFVYKGINNATVTPATYYNLEISPPSGSPTYLIGTTTGQTMNVRNNLTIGGSGNVTLNVNNYDPNLDIDGTLSIGSSDIFQASNSGSLTVGGSFTNDGTFTHNSGTLTIDTASVISTISSAANMSFYNFSVTTPGKVLQFKKHTANVPTFGFDNLFTITGSAGSPDNLITIRSDTHGSQWLVDFNAAQTAITYIYLRDSGCAVGSLSVDYSVTNSSGGNNGLCWNIGNIGAVGDGIVASVEQGSGGGTLRTGGGASAGDQSTEGGGGGGQEQGGGGQGGGGGGTP